jgi:hypothetical protein
MYKSDTYIRPSIFRTADFKLFQSSGSSKDREASKQASLLELFPLNPNLCYPDSSQPSTPRPRDRCLDQRNEMTSNSTSTSRQRAPSFSSSIRSLTRRWSAPSNAEEGRDAAAVVTEVQIVEEIDEIKRYEVRFLLGCLGDGLTHGRISRP